MGVYYECVKNKELAAKVMLLLIEFEFGLLGDDKPILVQSTGNLKQIEAIFNICKTHGWTTTMRMLFKGKNPYFRISMRGFREIYNIAGPFADPRKDRWAQLLLERAGKVGGYRGGEPSTEDKVLDFLKRNPDKRWRIEELCLELRLLPSTVRSALRTLKRLDLVRKNRVGKSFFYSLAAG